MLILIGDKLTVITLAFVPEAPLTIIVTSSAPLTKALLGISNLYRPGAKVLEISANPPEVHAPVGV
jgi:hypothetical protein